MKTNSSSYSKVFSSVYSKNTQTLCVASIPVILNNRGSLPLNSSSRVGGPKVDRFIFGDFEIGLFELGCHLCVGVGVILSH